MRKSLILLLAVLALPGCDEAKERPWPLGQAVFTSDGSKVGYVNRTLGEGGAVTGICFHTGSFLGMGGRYVNVESGQYIKAPPFGIQLGLTSLDVARLPESKNCK